MPSLSLSRRRLQLGLQALDARLPQHAATIRRLVLESRAFRDLVLDFTDAQLALDRWEKIEVLRDESRVAEYRGLVTDLASEIRALAKRASPHQA